LDEILDSDVVYGYHPGIYYAQDTFSCSECTYFIEHKRLKEDCSDIRKCVERMITKKDIATVLPLVFANYVARKMATVDVSKIICPLYEDVLSGGITVLFKKGIHFWRDSTF
jgi:hypothetical protein